jgi:hypothetical protein
VNSMWIAVPLTSGTGHNVMWLSHYAPMETSSPDDTGA